MGMSWSNRTWFSPEVCRFNVFEHRLLESLFIANITFYFVVQRIILPDYSCVCNGLMHFSDSLSRQPDSTPCVCRSWHNTTSLCGNQSLGNAQFSNAWNWEIDYFYLAVKLALEKSHHCSKTTHPPGIMFYQCHFLGHRPRDNQSERTSNIAFPMTMTSEMFRLA